MANTDFLWRQTLLASATFLVNSNTGNETGFSGLVNGSAVVSSVSGASGVFAPSVWGYGPLLEVEFNAGGAFTPTLSGALLGWFLRSIDGGTTFETGIGTPSTTVPYIQRAPDFVISLINSAHASGNRVGATGPVAAPSVPFKCAVQNLSGVTLPTSTTNWIKAVATTIQGVA